MEIIYHKKFIKSFSKQNYDIQNKFHQKLIIFIKNPYDITLNNHRLRGNLKHARSFDITGDVRVHYEISDGIIIITKIGTHSELY